MKHYFSALLLATITASVATTATARSPADYSDVEIAHVAYTADNIDIRYAHLALAISTNPAIHKFAKTMIRDHEAVNAQALALLERLGANAKNNPLSEKLTRDSIAIVEEMIQLRGFEFDRRYAANELAYHQAVNQLVEKTFIPNIDHAEVKALFEAGLRIFRAHERHAEVMVSELK